MEAYAVYLHLDLLEVVPGRGEQRRLIMSFIRSLVANPFTLGIRMRTSEPDKSRSSVTTPLLIGWMLL